MKKGLVVLVAAVAALGVALGQDGGTADSMEKQLAELKGRVAALEQWDPDALRQDTNRVRGICGLLLAQAEVPLAGDGRVGVYELYPGGDLTAEYLPEWFRNARTGVGPCMYEIKHGDYIHFPWLRYKGKVKLGEELPLLWDPRPGRDGKRLVGFATGAVKHLPEDEVRRILASAGQE